MDCLLQDGLCVKITIFYDHSHTIKMMEAYSQLRLTEESKEEFLDYFNDGHNIASAIQQREHNLTVAPSSL